MTRRNFTNLVIIVNLIGFALAFQSRESFFPYHAYDVYRKPMPKPGFIGIQSPLQATFYALDEDGSYYELGSMSPFFFPFDRFLFSEVLFFNTMRVRSRDPQEERQEIERRLKSQLRHYNSFPPWYRPKFLERIDVYWSDIELDLESRNTLDHKQLLFRVTHD